MSPLSILRGRPDAAIWLLVALIVSATVALSGILLLRDRDPSSAPSIQAVAEAGRSPRAIVAPAAVAVVTPEAPSDRMALFHGRLDAFEAARAALARAFASPSPVFARRTARLATPAVRVARGATAHACLSQAVYYEARGEPQAGQEAVAQVVLNRARRRGAPADLCAVVFEGASRPGCQFSFACDARLGRRPLDLAAWRRAETVAYAAASGGGRPDLADAVNYHADSVRPRWATRLERTAEIGRHIFYAAVRTATSPLPAGWRFVEPPAPAPASGA